MLRQIEPNNKTALWDSAANGISTLLKLYTVLRDIGLGKNCDWQFLHIVITDGCDTSSNMSFEQFGGLMLKMGLQLPKNICKTIFLGVDLGR